MQSRYDSRGIRWVTTDVKPPNGTHRRLDSDSLKHVAARLAPFATQVSPQYTFHSYLGTENLGEDRDEACCDQARRRRPIVPRGIFGA